MDVSQRDAPNNLDVCLRIEYTEGTLENESGVLAGGEWWTLDGSSEEVKEESRPRCVGCTWFST